MCLPSRQTLFSIRVPLHLLNQTRQLPKQQNQVETMRGSTVRSVTCDGSSAARQFVISVTFRPAPDPTAQAAKGSGFRRRSRFFFSGCESGCCGQCEQGAGGIRTVDFAPSRLTLVPGRQTSRPGARSATTAAQRLRSWLPGNFVSPNRVQPQSHPTPPDVPLLSPLQKSRRSTIVAPLVRALHLVSRPLSVPLSRLPMAVSCLVVGDDQHARHDGGREHERQLRRKSAAGMACACRCFTRTAALAPLSWPQVQRSRVLPEDDAPLEAPIVRH